MRQGEVALESEFREAGIKDERTDTNAEGNFTGSTRDAANTGLSAARRRSIQSCRNVAQLTQRSERRTGGRQ